MNGPGINSRRKVHGGLRKRIGRLVLLVHDRLAVPGFDVIPAPPWRSRVPVVRAGGVRPTDIIVPVKQEREWLLTVCAPQTCARSALP